MMKVVRSCERRTGGAQPNSRCFECGEKEARRRARSTRAFCRKRAHFVLWMRMDPVRVKRRRGSDAEIAPHVNEMGRGFFFTEPIWRETPHDYRCTRGAWKAHARPFSQWVTQHIERWQRHSWTATPLLHRLRYGTSPPARRTSFAGRFKWQEGLGSAPTMSLTMSLKLTLRRQPLAFLRATLEAARRRRKALGLVVGQLLGTEDKGRLAVSAS